MRCLVVYLQRGFALSTKGEKMFFSLLCSECYEMKHLLDNVKRGRKCSSQNHGRIPHFPKNCERKARNWFLKTYQFMFSPKQLEIEIENGNDL